MQKQFSELELEELPPSSNLQTKESIQYMIPEFLKFGVLWTGGRAMGWFCVSGGRVHALPFMQMMGMHVCQSHQWSCARMLPLMQVKLWRMLSHITHVSGAVCVHLLACHFLSPVPNGLQPSTGLQSRGWGSLYYTIP